MGDGRTVSEVLEDLAYELIGMGRSYEAECLRIAQAAVDAVGAALAAASKGGG